MSFIFEGVGNSFMDKYRSEYPNTSPLGARRSDLMRSPRDVETRSAKSRSSRHEVAPIRSEIARQYVERASFQGVSGQRGMDGSVSRNVSSGGQQTNKESFVFANLSPDQVRIERDLERYVRTHQNVNSANSLNKE